MKKISTIVTITGILLAISATPAPAKAVTSANPVYEINSTNTATDKTLEQKPQNKLNPLKINASSSAEKANVAKTRALANTKTDDFKQRASNEITRRITSLTHVINKISALKRLTDSQKAALTNDIQAEITSLTALNTKIQADTDIATLRTDVKSIVTSYRIYLLYLPQTQIIIAADALLTTADTFNELTAKLQTRINEAKSRGEDVSTLETTLANIQTKIADAKTQANNAIDAVSILKPTDYPGNKPGLQSARTMLQTAHKDLITAKQDAQKIIVELKKLNKNPETKPIKASESASNIPGTTSNTETTDK